MFRRNKLDEEEIFYKVPFLLVPQCLPSTNNDLNTHDYLPGVGFEILQCQMCPAGDSRGPSIVQDVVVWSAVDHIACTEQHKEGQSWEMGQKQKSDAPAKSEIKTQSM